MKTIRLTMLAVLFTAIANAQPLWNTQLNAISGTVSPNLGTSSNHPLNFYTNNTQQMVLSSTGVLKVTGLAGSGARFLQADGVGNITAWTGNIADNTKVLFGDNVWRLFPFSTDGSNIYTGPGSKLGIGVSSPAQALDVSGNANVTGYVSAPDGLRFSSNGGFVYDSSTGNFRLTKNPGPNDPVAYTDPCSDAPFCTFLQSSQGGFESFQSHPAGSNVNSKMRMYVDPYDGSGYIETTGKDLNNTNNVSLNLNALCGRNTNINTGGNGGNVSIATGYNSQLYTGDFVSMRKHLEIGDPNNHIGDVNNVALDINTDAGKGLRFRTNTDNIPLIYVEDNSNNTLKQTFSVLGDGHTEISTTNTDAFLIKNLNQSGNASFRILANGTTRIGGDYTPSTGSYMLSVNGSMIAQEVVIMLRQNWPDYVFTKGHKRMSLERLEDYINKNSHLPNVPSAKEIKEKGLNSGEMLSKQMEKIEELTLYLIEIKKEVARLSAENEYLKRKLK